MRHSTKLILIAGFGMIAGTSRAQISSRIDQFYLDPSMLNPASVALQKNASVNLLYNKTYSGVPGSPQNMLANLVLPMRNSHTGFGLFYLRENAGFQQLNNAYLSYAYAIPLADEASLSFGASVGVLTQNMDMSKAVYIDQNDPTVRAQGFSPSATRADFRASTMLNASGFSLGVAMSRLAKPRFDYSYYNYTVKYNLQSLMNVMASYDIKAGEDVMVKPSILFNFYDYKYATFKANLSVFYQNKFWAGLGTDASSQFGFNLGFRAGNAVSVGYSVNFLGGKVKSVLGPVHEIFTSIPFGTGRGKAASTDESGADKNPVADNSGDDESETAAQPATKERRHVETTVTSMDELQNAGMDLDTAGIHMTPLDKNKPEPGIYLVVGMTSSEAKADQMIKDLYMKGILAYKFYDPVNHSYYVWIKQFRTQAEATAYVQSAENSNLPESWIRVVK